MTRLEAGADEVEVLGPRFVETVEAAGFEVEVPKKEESDWTAGFEAALEVLDAEGFDVTFEALVAEGFEVFEASEVAFFFEAAVSEDDDFASLEAFEGTK